MGICTVINNFLEDVKKRPNTSISKYHLKGQEETNYTYLYEKKRITNHHSIVVVLVLEYIYKRKNSSKKNIIIAQTKEKKEQL